jgi:AcrR family transcriptional regulator
MSSARDLSLERIAAAALAIADAEGFSSVSMRRVATELGVGTMSLYYYVRNKAELIAAMDDALMAEIIVPGVPRGWREALTTIARRTREVYLRHPWALASMQSAPPGVNAMRHMEQCLEVLAGSRMSTQEKLTLLAVIDDFVFGYVLRETAGDPHVDAELAKQQLATGAFPHLAEAFGKGRVSPASNRFRSGIGALLDASAKRMGKPARGIPADRKR